MRALDTIEASGATGNMIHDAHIVTLCIEHGVTEFVSDFLRFALPILNPFT